jgi:tetratricopeptide (TPR) repeat protein
MRYSAIIMIKARATLLAALLAMAAPQGAAHAEDGYQLYAQERFAEAAAAFARQGGDATTHAAALIRLGRDGEAQALTDDVDPYRAVMRGAAALAAAGERGRAARLLESGLAQWPNDPDLLARRGALEMQGKRPLKALPYLARVTELAPEDPGARLALVRALLVAGMPVRVHQAIEAMRTARMDVGPELMDADIGALQSFGDHRQAVKLTERYLDQGGVATPALLIRLAISLEAIGSTTRAAERRRAAETLRPPKVPPRQMVALTGDLVRDQAGAAIDRGDWPQAATAAAEWARIRPDDPRAIAALLRPEIAERLGWGHAFAQVARLVDRDPDDPDRRLAALQAHAGSGGSTVMALIHAHHLDRLGQSGNSSVATGQVLREQIVARLALLGRITDLDLDQARLRLAPASSAPIEAKVHPRTGRMIHLREGFDRLEAVWEDDGTRLTQLTDSRGAHVDLTWIDGRLAAMSRTGKHSFTVELAVDGRPTRAEGPDVTDAFNATLDVVAAWQRADIADARRLRLGE